jgi:hypothetical protein
MSEIFSYSSGHPAEKLVLFSGKNVFDYDNELTPRNTFSYRSTNVHEDWLIAV